MKKTAAITVSWLLLISAHVLLVTTAHADWELDTFTVSPANPVTLVGGASGYGDNTGMIGDATANHTYPLTKATGNGTYDFNFSWHGGGTPDPSFTTSGTGAVSGDATQPSAPPGQAQLAPDGVATASGSISQTTQPGASREPSCSGNASGASGTYDIPASALETITPDDGQTTAVIELILKMTVSAYYNLPGATDTWEGDASTDFSFNSP